MSNTHLFIHPERTLFGQGVSLQAGQYAKELGGKKLFVVTDEIVADLDIFEAVEESLKKEGLDYYIYDEVDANPTDKQVERGAMLYQKEKADVLIAIGGGSSMDSAKAIGVLVNNGGKIGDYDGIDRFKNAIPFLIAIPTTAGTGSEVTVWAVITNTEGNFKKGVGGWKCIPKVALVDPVMMADMPPFVTASTGMDALSHAVEAYTSTIAMPQTDPLALKAIELIVENIGTAVADGSNMKAREGMAMGSLLAGMAFGSAGCGGVHALGHQLSTEYGMPHGIAMGIMMPVMMRFNMIACMDRYADIALCLGEEVDGLSVREAAEKAPREIHRLIKSVGLPTNLTEYGADSKRIPTMAKWAMQAGDLPTNPRRTTMEQIEQLFREAFEENIYGSSPI